MARISVIIAAYNAEKYLAETIESVQAQTVADWELLVVDDASRDNTSQIARRYAAMDPRIRVFRQEKSGGCAAPARNRGFAESDPRSEFVTFLDHDDLWKPFALETLLNALQADPDAIGAHGLCEEIDERGCLVNPDWNEVERYERRAIVGKRLVPVSPEARTTFAALAAWCCIDTPGLVLVRRSVLPPADPCPVYDGTGLDWDLWLQLCKQGEYAFVRKIILQYRQHPASASRNLKRLNQRIYSVRRRLWESPVYTEEQRALARRGYRAVERHYLRGKLLLAREAWKQGERKIAAQQARYAAGHLFRMLRGRP